MDVVSIGRGARLGLEAARAWVALLAAARAAGLSLQHSGARAGYRTPEEQAQLNAALGTYGKGGLAASVGRSRHQLGRALDISNVDASTPNYDVRAHLWLLENGPRFGWHPVGADFRKRREPWHWEWKETPVSG